MKHKTIHMFINHEAELHKFQRKINLCEKKKDERNHPERLARWFSRKL